METFPPYWPFMLGIHRSPVNSPQRPMTPSFDDFFDLCLNKRLSKQSWGWWFERPLRSLWRHCNGLIWYEPKQWLLVDMPHICHAHMWEILLQPGYPFRKKINTNRTQGDRIVYNKMFYVGKPLQRRCAHRWYNTWIGIICSWSIV